MIRSSTELEIKNVSGTDGVSIDGALELEVVQDFRGRHRRSDHHWRCAAHWSPEPQRGFRHRERAFHADSVLFTRCREGELRRCPGGGTCLGPARRLSNNKHSRPVGGKPSIGAFFGLRKTHPILQCLTKSPCIRCKTARDGPPGKRAIRTNLSNNG